MPKSWYEHWPLPDGSSASELEVNAAVATQYIVDKPPPRMTAMLDREKHISRFGNLTVVHYGVNRVLQNREYSKKREAFFDHSNLQLNRQLMQQDAWDEASIQARGLALFEFAVKIWRGPV